jgi:hypothetical protein
MPSPLRIFRAGKHRSSDGRELTFSDAELAASAAAYDPKLHEAPLVIGHPQENHPAYGWVKHLEAKDGALLASPGQVEPQFAELVNAGRFKKLSASFYLPDSPNNPKPGVYYLRHVGFLGAQPPAIKGLGDAKFASDAKGVVEFAAMADDDLDEDAASAAMARGLREFLIEKFGQDAADRVAPQWAVTALEQAASEDAQQPQSPEVPAYGEKEEPMDPKFAEKEADLEKRRSDLEKREQELAKRVAEARRAELVKYAETLVSAGRVLPKDKAALVAFLGKLPEGELTFGEAGKETKVEASVWVRQFLESLKPQVEFREVAGGGEEVGDDASAIARRAVEYQESQRKLGNEIRTSDAVAHVQKGGK